MNPNLFTSALTSLGVSALTTLYFQTYLTKRIEHHFQRRLEQFKANLEVQVHTKQEIAHRRLEAYPKIIEASYRTRNMARDLVQTGVSSESLQQPVARVRELEDMVFRYRVDLEADNLFVSSWCTAIRICCEKLIALRRIYSQARTRLNPRPLVIV